MFSLKDLRYKIWETRKKIIRFVGNVGKITI